MFISEHRLYRFMTSKKGRSLGFATTYHTLETCLSFPFSTPMFPHHFHQLLNSLESIHPPKALRPAMLPIDLPHILNIQMCRPLLLLGTHFLKTYHIISLCIWSRSPIN